MNTHFVVHGPEPIASKVRRCANIAWTDTIIAGGWQAPHMPVHIYLDASYARGRADVEADAPDLSTSRYDTGSYMVLSTDWADDFTMQSFLTHELNHVSHYAIDAAEDDAFYEHTATFVEARMHHAPESYVGIADFQAHPERSIGFMGGDGAYEYGAMLWLMFLSERFDNERDTLVQALWHAAAQDEPFNRVSYLDALPQVIGSDVRGFFEELCAWRYFTGARDDGKHFLNASQWPWLAPVTEVDTRFTPHIEPYGCALGIGRGTPTAGYWERLWDGRTLVALTRLPGAPDPEVSFR